MPRAKVQAAQPALDFIPPAYTPWLHRLCRLALPAVLASRGIRRCEVSGAGRLAELYAAAQAGQVRLLIAFRHPSTADPLVMAQLIWKELPRAARRHGIRLAGPVHSQFLYDRGIPLWAGAAAGWMLARLGGIPIQRGKLDRQALKAARHLLAKGPFPLAIAPEGATNNHNELLGPLEPGLAQMAFWGCEDLAAEGRSERVLIVPVVLQYVSLSNDWAPIDQLITELEALLGLPNAPEPSASNPADRRYVRLLKLAEGLIVQLETFYRRTYGQALETGGPSPAPGDFTQRLGRLRESALAVAESHFNLPPRGTISERCRRIEQAGWHCIYRDDLVGSSAVERSLADWRAAEAGSHMEHMRLVEYLATISGSYVAEKPSLDRYGEELMILWRASAWIRGRDDERPPALGPWTVRIRVGEPIGVDRRTEEYAHHRRSAVDRLTADLRRNLEEGLHAGESQA
jgi:1-acyl-sn-glycerol-3-phosphate acyltransferase